MPTASPAGDAGQERSLAGQEGSNSLDGGNGNSTSNLTSHGELQSGHLFDGGSGSDILSLAAGVTLLEIDATLYG